MLKRLNFAGYWSKVRQEKKEKITIPVLSNIAVLVKSVFYVNNVKPRYYKYQV